MTPIRLHVGKDVLQLITCIMPYLPAFDLLEYDFQVALWIDCSLVAKDTEHLIKVDLVLSSTNSWYANCMFRMLVACTQTMEDGKEYPRYWLDRFLNME